MIYHIITGDFAAGPLREAINLNTTLEGEVVVMKDVLSLGPLHDEAGLPFSALRSSFWQQVVPSEKTPIEVDDLNRLIETANELSKNPGHALWLWVAPLPADVCMYLWSLRYLSKYAGRIFVVNIAGLPFLDTESRLFFPSSFADITPTEIVKASRLARAVNPSEFEIDSEEWDRLGIENGMVRTLEGSKKIASKPVAFYDHFLLASCTHQYQKGTRIIAQAMSKNVIPTGDLFLGWRLRQLYESGRLILQGDPLGRPRDFEVRIPGEDQQLELGI